MDHYTLGEVASPLYSRLASEDLMWMTYFFLLVFYGAVASVLFVRVEWLKDWKPAHIIHVFVFAVLSLLYFGASGLTAGSFSLGAALGLGVVFLAYILVCFANAVAFACIASHYFVGIGHWLTSYNKILRIKTYDRAEGAEARKDFEKAAELYRESIEDDPEDAEAHRRLAEVLLKLDCPEDAEEEFRRALELAEEGGVRSSIAFRLAEVLDETLGRPEDAAEMYEMIVKQHPESHHAEFAKSRLRHLSGG